jgi:beta-glucosidase
MRYIRVDRRFVSALLALISVVPAWPPSALAQEPSVDARAAGTEQQMTDDERFGMIVSVIGSNILIPKRDPRISEGTAMSAGYMPGVPRLGVPALQSTDASLGVTNPGYRPDDKGPQRSPLPS